MKKYIFIILLFLLAYEAYPQVRLSTMDSVTTFTPTDLFWLNTKPSSAFLNRKVSWRSLRSNLEDFMADSAHTWALKQTFSSGATFSAGSNGTVTFTDSVVFASGGALFTYAIVPVTNNLMNIGTATNYYRDIYAKNFKVPNTEGNDSCTISYDDSVLTFTKEVSIPNLSVTDNFAMDSAAALQSLKINPEEYTIANVADSIIAIDSLQSNIMLNTPGNVVTPGIEKITMTGAAVGHIIILYTTEPSDSVVFQDSNSDGNLRMAGDFTMKNSDNIAFIFISDETAGFEGWMEIWRKDN